MRTVLAMLLLLVFSPVVLAETPLPGQEFQQVIGDLAPAEGMG